MHCATSMSPDVLVLPDPTGANKCASGQAPANIDFGDGKPYFVNFSDGYYYTITRAGSLYDKLEALLSLTSTEARFYRVDTFADSNNYSINYYRVFKDQMLNLLGGVIRNDPGSYGGYIDDNGQYRASPVVDLNTYGKLDSNPPTYVTAKRVDTPVNKTIRYYAMLLSMAQLDSTWDSTLDITNYLMVSLKGSNDDLTFSGATTVKEFTHPQTGQTYRAPVYDPANANASVGARLIDELNMITGQKGTPGTLPAHYGVLANGKPLPDWQTAKANLDQATAGTDQAALYDAQTTFQSVDYLLGYRVDLLGDLRQFRRAFGY
jgi:hypothetical protein